MNCNNMLVIMQREYTGDTTIDVAAHPCFVTNICY